jgi:hypothetical protein
MYVVRIIPIKREVSTNCNNRGKINFCSETEVGWYRKKKIEKRSHAKPKYYRIRTTKRWCMHSLDGYSKIIN